jgi:hypothetical protein
MNGMEVRQQAERHVTLKEDTVTLKEDTVTLKEDTVTLKEETESHACIHGS